MNDPLKEQVGGSHYKSMAIQPIELSMRNQYDAAIHSSMKYISRHQSKGGFEDISKAAHFVALREGHLAAQQGRHAYISIEAYIQANGIPPEEATVLRALHAYSRETHVAHSRPQAEALVNMMAELQLVRYGRN